MANAADIYAATTARIIDQIEAGAGKWVMPWQALASQGSPVSVEGRAYRGMNSLILPMVAELEGYESGVWGTYKAWQSKGAQVKKGEKATSVLFWKVLPKSSKAAEGEEGADEQGARRGGLIARGYSVFAAEQCEGAEHTVELRGRGKRRELDSPEQIEAAERFFAAIGAAVVIGGNTACYIPPCDEIRVPELAQFADAPSYYSTLAHEHTHWTGHKARLDRDLTGRFGSDSYAAEELVAELGAAMWSARMGISQAPRPDHAAYLASWLRVLRADSKAILTASSKAQIATDYLCKLAGIDAADEQGEEGAAAA